MSICLHSEFFAGTQRKMRSNPPSKRILVHNLSPSTSSETLKHVFGKYGNIEHVYIPSGTNSRGQIYGFVDFANVQQAQIAFDVLNNTSLEGSVLHFQFVEAKDLGTSKRSSNNPNQQRVVPTPAPLQAAAPLNPTMEMTRYNTAAGGEFTIDSAGRLTRRRFLEEEQRTGRARSPASQNPLLVPSAITIASAEKPVQADESLIERTGIMAYVKTHPRLVINYSDI
jgi:RNA recognition motif-containing protein